MVRSMIPYGRHKIDEDDIKAIIAVLQSDFLTTGPKIQQFEEEIARYTGAKYATVVSNGTAALHVACLAANLEQNQETITSPMTFAASANCAIYCGAKPRFADIKDNGLIDDEKVRKKINTSTRIIIPVHYAGFPCDMERIGRMAKEHGLVVIEDACHALGSRYRNTRIGDCAYSDMAVFSFHPVKHITTGEGGAITTNSEIIDRRLKVLRTHGITKDGLFHPERAKGSWYYEMQMLGYNYRMTDIQAALGSSQLKRIEQFVSRRREISRQYYDAFEKNRLLNTIPEPPQTSSSFHLFPVLIKPQYASMKSRIFSRMQKEGLGVQVHYIPVNHHPFYEGLGYQKEECPVANSFYEREISLPLYPGLDDEKVNKVIDIVNKMQDLV